MRRCRIVCLSCLLSATTLAGACQNLIAYYGGNGKNLAGYHISELTHIIFSFCHLKGAQLSLSGNDSVAVQRLVRLKDRYRQLKILLSLGGWGGCSKCSAVFSTDSGRRVFALSVKTAMDYFHADGIDIDWEFPSFPSYPGQTYSLSDPRNLSLLVAALRATLDQKKEISVLAAAFSPYLENSIEWLSLSPLVSRFNLMTYDIIGSKSPITGHHAALYSTPMQKQSADHALRYLDSLGVPKSKLVIGVALYAREFNHVPDVNNGLYQKGKFLRFLNTSKLSKSYGKSQGFHLFWDSVANAAYSFNPQEGVFLTYDNDRSAKSKADYVKSNRLNGVMFWNLAFDRQTGGVLDILYNTLKK